jgi:glycosyltransferase involved in cell wall biosynthesis
VIPRGSPVLGEPSAKEDTVETALGDVSIGFVSTYPPTVCGLATYTESLLGAIAGGRGAVSGLGVVDVGDDDRRVDPRVVAHRHLGGDARSLDRAAEVLNSYDTVSIQHEFGIFAGPDGEEVLDLMNAITVPTAVTFHTVLDDPTRRQRAIIDRLALEADRLVVMSKTGSERLTRRYHIDPERIDVIPHGANTLFSGPSLAFGDRPLVLTWGLIGPGKGLESAILALSRLADLDPAPRYLIAGATHPHVRESAGESYRESLVGLARDLGLEDIVEFDDRYLDRADLARLVRSADLVVLPYASTEQVTSGVLAEAIAASKPVVATRFPHAVELLTGGAGLTVPHGDAGALAEAIRFVLTDHVARSGMGLEARRTADGWFWPTIGARFSELMSDMATARSLVGALAGSGPEVRHVTG